MYERRGVSRWVGVLALVSLVAGGCAHDDAAEHGPVVKRFEIEGTEHVEPSDIKKVILTAETSWLPFSKKRRLDRNVWNEDLKRIRRYLQAQGYYQAEVVSSDIDEVGKDEVALTVKVREGQPTKVTSLTIEGLEQLSEEEQQEVKRAILLDVGDVFVEGQWSPLPEALQEVLVNLGYAEAKVQGDAKVDLARRTADLQLSLAPGIRYRVGEVRIHQAGQPRVAEWRVREQVREVLEADAWYSQDLRQEIQERVFDMGVFGAAQVQPGEGNPDTATLPLNIELAEAPFHEVAYGFGIGFEQRRQEAHVRADYTHRDFLGGLRKLELGARAGWAFIPNFYTATGGRDAVTKSGPLLKLSGELEQPRLWHPNVRLLARTELERAVETAYSFTGGRARLGVPWKPRTWLTVEPSYNLEIYKLTAGATSLESEAPELLFGCGEVCVLSYLEERIAFDRRDDPLVPKEGFYAALALQQGGGPLGGSFEYFRIAPEVRGYYSLLEARRLTFAARAVVGTLIPLGGDDRDTPIVARFFSGGDGMRGFSARRLSPMRLVEKTSPQGDYDAEPTPVGGNGMFEASLEARYSLTEALTLALFVDAGAVTTERVPFDRPAWLGENLLWAVGTGARYQTPVGPIRLDLAYRLPFGPPLTIREDDRGLSYLPAQGCFGIGTTSPERGGAPEGVCAIHLSIGEAF